MTDAFGAYGGLFLAAFVAATILPAQSEGVLVYLLTQGYAAAALVTVASVGNTLGACVNWWLGRSVERYRDKKWFPVSPAKLEQAQNLYHRYGRPLLLLSWLPIIGDAITVAAGVMRERFWVFTLLVGIAKTWRYLAIALAVG